MDNNPFENLDKLFDTPASSALEKNLRIETDSKPLTVSDEQQKPIHDRQLENDFQDARETLKRAADYSEEAIQGILHVAKSSDHPRAFEVAAQLIKGMQENAIARMDVQEKQRKMKYGKTQGSTPQSQSTNNIFVGSTSELLKAIKNEKPVNE